MVSLAIAARSPLRTSSTVENGATLASSGLALTSAGTLSRTYITCVYIGCSTHSVPSWSKVAMRSAGGTNCGLALSVVAFTKPTIACLAARRSRRGGDRLLGVCTQCKQGAQHKGAQECEERGNGLH